MKRIELNGIWKMSGNGYAVEGKVPGSMYSFLHIDNEILPDPYFRNNEDIYLALAEKEFVFENVLVALAPNSLCVLLVDFLVTVEKLFEFYLRPVV